MYLNRAYFGSGLYGVKAASRRYFSNSPEKLNLAESAILVGTLKAPSKLSFLVNKELSIKRAKLIISLLFQENLISKAEKWLKKLAKSVNISPKMIPRCQNDPQNGVQNL